MKPSANNAKSNQPSTSKSNSEGCAGLATSAEWKWAACCAACFGENVLFTGGSNATRPRKFGHNKSTTTWRPTGLASQRRRTKLATAKCGRTLVRRSDIQRHPQQQAGCEKNVLQQSLANGIKKKKWRNTCMFVFLFHFMPTDLSKCDTTNSSCILFHKSTETWYWSGQTVRLWFQACYYIFDRSISSNYSTTQTCTLRLFSSL